VAAVAIDALPCLAVGILVTVLEAQEIRGEVRAIRAGVAIVFPPSVGAQLGPGGGVVKVVEGHPTQPAIRGDQCLGFREVLQGGGQ